MKLQPVFLFIFIFFLGTQLQAQLAVSRSSSTHEYLANPMKNSYEVVDLSVHALLQGQMANVTVTQTIYNPGNRNMEVEIFFPLPDQAAIQNFVLMVDGVEIPGELLPKEEATRIYEGIVRQKQDPALMEYVGYGLFKTAVFPIPVGQQRKITVSYSSLCPKKYDLVTFSYPLGTQKFSAKALKKVSFKVSILSAESIKNIYSPSDQIITERQNNNEAIITMEKHNVLPEKDFQLVFSLASGTVGANLISYKAAKEQEGYFMLMASPSVESTETEKVSKTVVFVLDRSGSMTGQKIEQSKKAIEFILGNLRKNDLFNIITFDDRVTTYKPELQRYNSSTYKEALQYVKHIHPGGSTNINGALLSGMGMFQDKKNPNYLIFLTDGAATAGVVDEMQIASNCQAANKQDVKLFSFGVGVGVNARLLDRLSTQNNGMSDYVQNDNELEAVLSRFYSGISDPVLTNINIKFNGTDIYETYPQQIPDLFKGGQLVLTGKYRNAGKASVTITGKIGPKNFKMDVPVEFASEKDGSANAYVEQLWATRRIGHIMEQIDLHGKNDEMVQELVALSTKHGILTPYTAFLAREDADFRNTTSSLRETNAELDKLEQTQGQQANDLRKAKNSLKNASAAPSADAEKKTLHSATTQQNLRQVGNKTFYLRNGNWVESTISEVDEQKALKVSRYSSEYFELAKNNSANFNQYLAIQGNVVLRLNEQTYLIE